MKKAPPSRSLRENFSFEVIIKRSDTEVSDNKASETFMERAIRESPLLSRSSRGEQIHTRQIYFSSRFVKRIGH